MSERDQMLIALVKEVLGPRNGPQELLPEEDDPRTEYITGVLEPASASRPSDMIEDEVDEVIEETTSEEDQDMQGYVAVPGVFSPALNPKSLPRSIGLSFTVETNGIPPQLEICATWARYYLEQSGWRRYPSCFLTGAVRVDTNRSWQAAPGVALELRSKLLSQNTWRVSLFLINTTNIQSQFAQTSDYLFQPQIRVHCHPDTFLVPVKMASYGGATQNESGSMELEDISLGLLYRERTALARGHMCGVTWRGIDPEQPHSTLSSPGEAPFVWIDGGTVPQAYRGKFSPADVRTEMVPCYPVQTPDMEWQSQFAPSPQFDPALLAEIWDEVQIRNSLQSLVDGYNAWIAVQQNLLNGLPAIYQPAALANIQECRQAAARIQEAIEILCNDEDARLAFCFANMAIHLQAQWKKPGDPHPLIWRPFQLAFILLNIPPLANPFHPDRNTCDLLWFPTGGGKTEAYLGLAAFVLALRRLRARQNNNLNEDRTGAGVSVLSRYTLRLLTIQQFRRALGVITACELLRVWNLDSPGLPVGWRPGGCRRTETFIWGGIRFSAGLWVGGGVTPNSLLSIGPMPSPDGGMMMIAGALDILQGIQVNYNGPNQIIRDKARRVGRNLEIEGDPAQVTSCPCCRSILAIPDEGLGPGTHTLHFVYQGGQITTPNPNLLQHAHPTLTINNVSVFQHQSTGYRTLTLTFSVPDRAHLRAEQVDEWWHQTIAPAIGRNVILLATRPARPGYFILTYQSGQHTTKQCDFDIYCPNPQCELNHHVWAEQVPLTRDSVGVVFHPLGQMPMGITTTAQANALPVVLQDRLQWQVVPEAFEIDNTHRRSTRIPIPALTVDDQVYHRCPSMVIATVDKFARLAYEPKAAALFGNISHYHSRWGYYREGCPPSDGTSATGYRAHPAGGSRRNPLYCEFPAFPPPDLILQDELHLIEGPLGSMVGLYETAVDTLCQRTVDGNIIAPKYIASTATVRQAETQIQALFNRQLYQFPPAAVSADERFFATDCEIHALDNSKPGRLYVAVCAPGKGAQTPIVRIWSGLLQIAHELLQVATTIAVDPFWTLVGYFNATRELAGALSLYRQDIPERIAYRARANARTLDDSRRMELSSRASSMNLPVLLQKLEVPLPNAQDAVFATSMFGTGVDIDRLSLMVVHGQPKTTAAYIQATGRVGRKTSGLVVTFFRASRPRDLDHYEFFTGYHRALYRHVEPVTVAPFSPRARERALGPLTVVLLRQARVLSGVIPVSPEWRVQQRVGSAFYSQAFRMASHRFDPEVTVIPDLFESRSWQQPAGRRPLPNVTAQETISEIDRWHSIAAQHPNPNDFVYNEPALLRQPQRHVVLGDSQHRLRFDEAYENAPQSLREVEETTGFKV